MSTTLQILHWLAGLIILAEALNKLERTAPCAPGLTPHARLVASLKALAWALLALGGAVVVFAPLFAILHATQTTPPSLSETAIAAGFAVLIIRTRVKEG